MTEAQETKPKLTQEEFVDKLTKTYSTLWECEADLKDLLAEAKEAEIEDIALIKELVKAKVWNKIGDLLEKTQAKLDKAEELGL